MASDAGPPIGSWHPPILQELTPPDRLRVDLCWRSDEAANTETRVLRRPGSDLPGERRESIRLPPAGRAVNWPAPAGSLLLASAPALRIELPGARLPRLIGGSGPMVPRIGRFYPQALADEAGLFDEPIVCNGAGMQARCGHPGAAQATDFFADDPFARAAPHPDAVFYTQPGLVDHLDAP